MDVFWLNHSITFLPIKAASVGSLYYLTSCRGIVGYNRRVAGVHGRTRGSCHPKWCLAPAFAAGAFSWPPLAASTRLLLPSAWSSNRLARRRIRLARSHEFHPHRAPISPYRSCRVLSHLAANDNAQSEFGGGVGGLAERQLCAAFRKVLDQTFQTISSGEAKRSLNEYGVTRRLAAL